MERNISKSNTRNGTIRASEGFDLDALLHPAQAFADPMDIINDPDLTLNEKRAILASWASDACAVETAPELRQAPNGRTIKFDDIMNALSELDRRAQGQSKPTPNYRRVLANRIPGVFGRKSGAHPTTGAKRAGREIVD